MERICTTNLFERETEACGCYGRQTEWVGSMGEQTGACHLSGFGEECDYRTWRALVGLAD